MIWYFSDGTIAKLGGEIEGGTAFAQELRHLLADPKQRVQVKPIPDEAPLLDRNNPALFDRFLRNEMERPCNSWMMISLLKAPEVEPLKFERHEEDIGDALY